MAGENRDQTLSAQKLALLVSALGQSRRDHLGLLVISGSFNPVHTQHTRVMEMARRALERIGWAIVGGVLAPSGDSYLQGKVNSHALSLQRRTELCQLSIEGSDWLAVSSLGEFRSHRACTTIRTEVEQQCAVLLEGRKISGVEVMGSDTAIRLMDRLIEEWAKAHPHYRSGWYHERIVCCIIRPDFATPSDAKGTLSSMALQTAEMGITLIPVDSEHEGPALQPLILAKYVICSRSATGRV